MGKKVKKPSFFSSKGFPEELLKKETDQQLSKTKDKVMAKEGDKKSRKRLTSEQVARMIKEWDNKSISEWADEFDVSYQTISKMAETVRKEDPKLCPKKTAVKVKRADIAKEAIALLKKGEK